MEKTSKVYFSTNGAGFLEEDWLADGSGGYLGSLSPGFPVPFLDDSYVNTWKLCLMTEVGST